MKYSFAFLATAAVVAASPYPQAVTKAIAPSASAPAGCSNTYSGSFGLVVLTEGQQLSKRAVVTQISDGQIQAPTYGAPAATTSLASPTTSAAPVPASSSSFSKSSSAAAVQSTSSKVTSAAAVPVNSSKASSAAAVPASSSKSSSAVAVPAPSSKVISSPAAAGTSAAARSSSAAVAAPSSVSGLRILPAVTQINDGQIQAPRLTSSAAAAATSSAQAPRSSSAAAGAPGAYTSPASPAPAATSSSRAAGASSAATTSPRASSAATSSSSSRAVSTSAATGTAPRSSSAAASASPSRATGTAVSRISDGQPQAPTGQASPSSNNIGACAANGTLTLTLSNGVLKDARGWTGYIASNNQFQFDNPPQSGSIYTAGWSVCSNGSLALGGSAQFWQCLSGGFYNLYNANIAPQCSPITLNAAKIVQC